MPPALASGAEYVCWGIVIHDADLGRVGKTGLADESVSVDLDRWLWDPLRAIYETREKNQGLWRFSLPELRLHFKKTVEALNGMYFGSQFTR